MASYSHTFNYNNVDNKVVPRVHNKPKPKPNPKPKPSPPLSSYHILLAVRPVQFKLSYLPIIMTIIMLYLAMSPIATGSKLMSS